jgi:hypothetical protein
MKVGFQSKTDNNIVENTPSKVSPSSTEKTKYLVWHIEGGLGKNVAATSLLEPISQKYSDRKIIVVASYPEVFINNPYVHRIYRVGMTSYFYDDYIKDQDTLVFRHEPYFQTAHILKKKHLIENWADLLDVKYEGQFPSIYFNLVQKQLPFNWLREKPILLLQTNGGPFQGQTLNYSWTRDIPYALASQIVEEFKNDYHIIQLTRQGALILEGVEVIDYPLSNMELFGLIAVSEKRVLIDSSPQHVAAALNLPSTVLWIGTSPSNFGYNMHSNVIANPPNGNTKLIDAYLFDYSFEGVPHECPYSDVEEMFNVNDVINSIKKI